MKRRSALLTAIGALAGALLPRASDAWVPPGDFLLGKVADRRKSVKGVLLKGIRTFVGRNYDGGKQDVSEEMWGTVEGLFRLERKTPKGDYLEVSDGKKHVVYENGKPGAQEADPHPLERLLLLNATKEDLLKSAQAFGIKLEISSLARLDLSAPGDAGSAGARVCWVLGAKEGDTVSPALWIDKDRSFPLQLDDPRSKRRIRWEGWSEGVGAGLFPARVSIYRGDDLEQELKIAEAKINPKLAADLFKPDAPIAATPTPAPTATPKATPTATPAPTPTATPTPKPAAKASPTPKPKAKPTPKPKPKKR